jgi:putative peptidoglycan lipid II flippase
MDQESVALINLPGVRSEEILIDLDQLVIFKDEPIARGTKRPLFDENASHGQQPALWRSPMPRGVYQKIGLATLIMMASIFLSRVLGYVRELVIAAVAGADVSVDAYRVAFVLPEILNHILASGFLSVTFIPIFSAYLVKDDDAGAWRISSIILTTFGALMVFLIIIGMVFTTDIVPLLALGRTDPEFLEMAIHMTRIVLPAQFFFFAGGVLMAVQFAKERFLVPALAPLIYNLGIICGGLILGGRVGVAGFAWGALVGAFGGNFVIQIFGARHVGLRFRFQFDWKHKDLRRYILLTLPLMLGLTMIFSMEIFSKFFGSYLQAGGIAWLDYAKTIMMMLVAFFGQAVGVASYPFLARLAARQQWDEMNRMFNTVLRHLADLVIPASVLIFVLRYEIVRVLFERMAFNPEDTRMTALALGGLLLGAVAICAQTVVNRGFYAMQNTLLPAVYGTIAVMASLPIYWLGLKMYGLLGVALAISVSSIIQVAVLFSAWNHRSGNKGSLQVYGAFLKAALTGILLGTILWLARCFVVQRIDPASVSGSILTILVIGTLFMLCMALAGWLFKVEGIQSVSTRILQRLRSRQDGKAADPGT